MNILYIAHRIPYPPNKGDKIRSYHTLAHLVRRHSVSCACFVDDPADMNHVPELRKLCREVIALPLSRRASMGRAAIDFVFGASASEGFYRRSQMARALESLAERVRFDAVLAFSSTMAQYAAGIPAARKVIDLCDLDSEKWADKARCRGGPAAWLLETEARRVRALENRIAAAFDAVVLISHHEADGWQPPPGTDLRCVSNGVTLPDIHDDEGYDSGVVGFTGDMRYFPNDDGVIWFAHEVWPFVKAHVPHARFDIIGRGPSAGVRRLPRQAGINVVGEVESITQHLRRLQVSVAPLRIARGVQNKVLEAMAAARPVVTTTAAARGIEATAGQHFFVSDAPEQMAARVVNLLQNPAGCRAIGRRARTHVAGRYDWDSRMNDMEALLIAGDAGSGDAAGQRSGQTANMLSTKDVSKFPAMNAS